jgi:hypothetical protein
MSDRPKWWDSFDQGHIWFEGICPVKGYSPEGRPPDEVAIVEKARLYGADAVFFQREQGGQRITPQALIYGPGSVSDDQEFASLHRKLWSWGGVPIVYRRTPGLLQLFRCAHQPDFLVNGKLRCNPIRQLALATQIDSDPWWDEERIRSGALWDDPEVCKLLLSNQKAAHKSLFDAFRRLSDALDAERILPKGLRRRLLILSLLIAYLEQRGVFPENFFAAFLPGASRFFEVLREGPALVNLLSALEERFNGNVFSLDAAEAERLTSSQQLERFSRLVEAKEDKGGQLSLWDLYSFRDLPVELISQIYQLFVENSDSSVYTPPFLVRFLVEEALSWERLDHLTSRGQIVLDPACGSGVFLVEAYKRLVLHWRSRHAWKRPQQDVLKGLLHFVHGVDLEQDAVELAGFSLCLAMCDALEPEEIRQSIKLFPVLKDQTLHHGCFFEAKESGRLPRQIGAILGNPPFASNLQTDGASRAYARYHAEHGKLPDRQVGYLFLHEAAEALEDGGIISMLQQYNFLYNQGSLEFRRGFLHRYWVREVLDFISVRGLFHKGNADTKVVVVVAEKRARPSEAKLLHATFRRTGRLDAEQGFDLDYYDLHYVPYELALRNDRIWRANLLGGARALAFADRFASMRTLREHAKHVGWEFGEGFIEGKTVDRHPAKHLTGKPCLPSSGLTGDGIDSTQIHPLTTKLFRSAYTERRFSPPMLLVKEQMELAHALWTGHYLTYSQRMVGFCVPKERLQELQKLDRWLTEKKRPIRAYLALTSPGLFAQKATALQADDIYSIPYPEEEIELGVNEAVIVDDIVDYQADLIRLGEGSTAMGNATDASLRAFDSIFCEQVSSVYRQKLMPISSYRWAGAICQAYSFGTGVVDWDGASEMKMRVVKLLREQVSGAIQVNRICRLYEGNFVFLLKPDRLRYWLRSIALRDGDDVLADLRAQGY